MSGREKGHVSRKDSKKIRLYLAKPQRPPRGTPRDKGEPTPDIEAMVNALGSNHAPVFAFRFPPCLRASVRVGAGFLFVHT